MKSDSPKKNTRNTPKSSSPPKKTEAKPAKPLQVPPILLEGDNAPAPAASGPGARYALGPGATAGKPGATAAELPESYGTKRLLLTARDPHWVYAHWDLTREQQKEYNALSVDKHLVVRVFKDNVSGEPATEVHVHPESKNWFINVGQGGTRYIAELGYYQKNGKWASISTSSATLTPPDTMSEDFSVWFETLPAELQFSQLLKAVKAAVSEHVPLMEAMQQMRKAGHKDLPSRAAASGKWTPEQERALSGIISMDSVRRVWMGSLEITELIRRQLQTELSSAAAALFSQSGSWSGAVSSLSSPFGGEKQKGFWFNVNAELIIYGATEPTAEVTIGGRVIKLRPDGTFSYRFALPDGHYDLPAIATSADATDQRAAELVFSRASQYRGDIGKHPQDASLKPPRAENVS